MSDNAFHDHLDICERCRDRPFDLCRIGYETLVKAVTGKAPQETGLPLTEEEIMRMPMDAAARNKP